MNHRQPIRRAALAAALAIAFGLAAAQGYPPGVGPHPTLPPVHKDGFIPNVHIAKATQWTGGAHPSAPPGFAVTPFATGLEHPRWVYTLPNGDVLVAESNKPPAKDGQVDKMGQGLRGKAMKLIQKRAGAGVESPNKIILLRDADGDGIAETRRVFMTGLFSPFGMALVGNTLYIANADAIVKVPYETGQTSITAAPVKVTDLPAGANHHWTKNILATPDGRKLYATVGSNSNVLDNGLASEEGRAAIWEVDLATGQKRLFATGLRNPNGLAWEPQTHALWTVVNERDELGNDLVPDYLTSVKDGAFYGWPWSYWGQHVDDRAQPPHPDLVAQAIEPDYGLGSHRAPLGLTFSDARMPAAYANGAFIGEHGSWNRKPRAGYKVVFVPFANGHPSGPPQDFLAGFLDQDEHARGRPVGVTIDSRGGLLVADDVGNTVWRVSAAK